MFLNFQLMRWAPFKVWCAAATATATATTTASTATATAAGAEHGGKSECRAECLWANWQQVPSFSCCTSWFPPHLFACIVQTYVPPKGPARFQAPVKPEWSHAERRVSPCRQTVTCAKAPPKLDAKFEDHALYQIKSSVLKACLLSLASRLK